MARLTDFIPLVLLLIFVGCFAWVAYQMYLYSQDLAEKGQKHMLKRNISWSRDGAKVGVRELSAEELADRQQKHVVSAWNLSTWPAYKSMFWNKQPEPPAAASASSTATPSKSKVKAK